MTTVKVIFFAVSKDIFGTDLEFEDINNIGELATKLNQISDSEVIKSFRYAVNNKIIDQYFQFENGTIISVIPPSSGG